MRIVTEPACVSRDGHAVRRATLLPFRESSQVEVPAGFVHVLCNLFAQRFHRGKLDLIPQALQKEDLDFGVGPASSMG